MKSLVFVLLAHSAIGFQTPPNLSYRPLLRIGLQAADSSAEEEQRAAAMSDYLAKAHEAKLKAVEAAEKKKQAEIDALKSEIQELQTAVPATSGMVLAADKSLEAMTKEELVAKVIQYQNFLQKYMIEAQEQKRMAVLAAEASTKQKFEAVLLQLQPGGATAAVSAAAKTSSPLFEARNAAILKAAKAGKTRWGDAEIQKTAGISGPVKITSTAAPAQPAAATSATIEKPKILPSTVAVFKGGAAPPATINGSAAAPAATPATLPPPPEVIAADHGLRADGGVGGPSLADRVSSGANLGADIVAQSAKATTSSPDESLYQQRNVKVMNAAKAGKSRWGQQEVDRVERIVDVSLPGGGPPSTTGVKSSAPASLAERVNLGAQLVAKHNAQ